MDDKVRARVMEARHIARRLRKNDSSATLPMLIDAVHVIVKAQERVDRRPAPTAKPLTWAEAKINLELALDHMEEAHSGYSEGMGYDGSKDCEIASFRDAMAEWPESKDDHEDEMLTRNQKS